MKRIEVIRLQALMLAIHHDNHEGATHQMERLLELCEDTPPVPPVAAPKPYSELGLDTNSLMFLLRDLFVEGETVNPNEYPSWGFAQAYAALEKAARDTVMNYPHIPPLEREK